MVLPLFGTGCDLLGHSATVRYRLIVEVLTPKGLRTASSVIESTISMRPTVYDRRAISYKVKGQAVAVDLPGGTLFAVLNNSAIGYDYPTYLLNNALNHGNASPPLSRRYDMSEWIEETAEAKRVKPTVVLQAVDYPTLIRFRNPAKATSMEVVDPKDLAAVFGQGVHLQRILLQVTDVPVVDSGRVYLAGAVSDYTRWRSTLPWSDVRQHLTLDNFSRNMR